MDPFSSASAFVFPDPADRIAGYSDFFEKKVEKSEKRCIL